MIPFHWAAEATPTAHFDYRLTSVGGRVKLVCGSIIDGPWDPELTASILACYRRKIEICSLLLELGADRSQLNSSGLSVFDIAARRASERYAKF